MSKKIRALVMALVLASITSTGAFADSNTVNTTYDERNEAIALQEDPTRYVRDSDNNPIRKTLTPVGDGTRLYESKLGRSSISVNNVVGAGREDHLTMLWAKGPVTVNFNGSARYIFQYDTSAYRVSGGKVVFISPQMDNSGYVSVVTEKSYLKELPFQADYQQDKSVTLAEPGLYRITDGPGEGGNECLLYVGNSGEDLNLVESKIENAVASSLNVTVTGKTASLPAYSINGESYIRAKDLAYILNKTNRQFDATSNNIITYHGYVPNGSELKALPSGNAVATPYTEKFMLNNEKTQPSIYTINNEQFISLSDMKAFLNLNLSVNGNAVTVNAMTDSWFVAKPETIPTDSDGRIKADVVCLEGRYYMPGERVGYNISYNTININGLTDEQIKEMLTRYDTKKLSYTGISAKLMAELKEKYEIKSALITSDAELKEILDKCK